MFLLGAFHGQMLVAKDLPVAKSVGRAVTIVFVPMMYPPSSDSPSRLVVPSRVVLVVSAVISGDINSVLVVVVVSVVTDVSVVSL
jgi:hypothetical protein